MSEDDLDFSQYGTPVDPTETPSTGFSAPQRSDVENYIRQGATQRGIDPNIAATVFNGESGFDHAAVGDGGTSFGPTQLHYGGGLGDVFTKQTGLHASDPSTWKQQVDFSLDQAKQGGWGPWHAWKGHPYAGLSGGPAGQVASNGGGQRPRVTVDRSDRLYAAQSADPEGFDEADLEADDEQPQPEEDQPEETDQADEEGYPPEATPVEGKSPFAQYGTLVQPKASGFSSYGTLVQPASPPPSGGAGALPSEKPVRSVPIAPVPPANIAPPPPLPIPRADALPVPPEVANPEAHGIDAEEGATAPTPGAQETESPGKLSIIAQAGTRGGIQAIKDSADAFRDWHTRQEEDDPSYVGKLIQTPVGKGWKDSDWWAAQMAYSLGNMSPALAASIGLGAAGEAIAGPPGAIAGAAAGFGGVSALQEIAPAYARARADGLDHDAAVDRAWKETGIVGGVSALMGAIPGGTAAEATVKQKIGAALRDIFITYPALGEVQSQGIAAVEGKTRTPEEVAQSYALGALTGVVLIGGHHMLRLADGKTTEIPGADASKSEVDDFLAKARGVWSRQEIDEFLRQKAAREAAQEAGKQLALPAPGGAEGRPPEPPGGGEPPPPPPPGGGAGPAEPAKPAAQAPAAAGGTEVSPADRSILEQMGYDKDHIDEMSPAQRAENVKEGTEGGLKPKAGYEDFGRPVQGEGTRASPAVIEHEADLTRAADQVNVEPSDAQKEAGNYQKGHVRLDGFDISIENPAGSVRKGVDENGEPYESKMPVHYGYLKRTEGADGDQLDVYVAPQPKTGAPVYVVDQIDPKTGKFDEHKALMGFPDSASAQKGYADSFSDGSGPSRIGAMTELTNDEFKSWVKSADTKEPIRDQGIGKQVARAKQQAALPAPTDHHAAIISHLNSAGVHEGDVEPHVIQKAADIMRDENVDAPTAFEKAVMRDALESGAVTPAEMDENYGKGTADELQPATALQHGEGNKPAEETKGTGGGEGKTIGGPRPTAPNAEEGGGVPRAGEAGAQGGAETAAGAGEERPAGPERGAGERVPESGAGAEAELQPEAAKGAEDITKEPMSGRNLTDKEIDKAVERLLSIFKKKGHDAANAAFKKMVAGKTLGHMDQEEIKKKYVAVAGRPGEPPVTGKPVKSDRDTKFQARIAGETVTVQGYVGRNKAESYTFPVNEWPTKEMTDSANAFEQRKYVEKLLDLANQENFGKVGRNVDAVVATVNDAIKQRGPVEEEKPEAEKTKEEIIQDAGEKIGGARKDLWTKKGLSVADLDKMNEGEKKKYTTKENVWPRPDYAEAVTQGMTPTVAAQFKLIYDRLRTTAPYGDITGEAAKDRELYIDMMNAIRGRMSLVKTDEEMKAFSKGLKEAITAERDEQDVRNMYRVVSAKRFWGDPTQKQYGDERKIEEMVKQGFPNQEPWHRLYAIRDRSGWGDRYKDAPWVVIKKSAGEVATFKTKAEAEAGAKAAYEAFMEGGGGRRELPDRPHLDDIERTGPNYREGRDVDSKDFINDFGFRGVEFGNWAAGDERQKLVNFGYDALHDLARTIGLPPKAISLDGTLALAFGARGKGGKRAAAAHYEPLRHVINMTKINGAGSLAHEWWHALDHYLGELDKTIPAGADSIEASGGDTPGIIPQNLPLNVSMRIYDLVQKMHYDKETPEARKKRIESRLKNQQEGLKSWEDALERYKAMPPSRQRTSKMKKAMEQRDVWRHSIERQKRTLSEEKDRQIPSDYFKAAQGLDGKNKPYYAQARELAARSFESFIFDQITNDKLQSQYLVHGVEGSRHEGNQFGNPYPVGAKRAELNKAWKSLFKYLQVGEGKLGPETKLEGKRGEYEPDIVEVSEPNPEEGNAPLDSDSSEKAESITNNESEGQEAGVLSEHFLDHFRADKGFENILQARKLAKEKGFSEDAKQVEEAIELAVVKRARELVEGGAGFDQLVDLYGKQPKLGTRTSTSIRDQAYSTPVPLAYVADRLAGIDNSKTVYEPSAGNGALLILADPKKVWANEINPARANNLKEQDFNVSEKDASDPVTEKGHFDRVIANPPFGAVKEEGVSKVFDMKDIAPGYETTQIDHAIALRALERMRDGGKAVLLIGAIHEMAATPEARFAAYNGKNKREFFKALYDRYNVTDHFTVAGDLYERQGAGWPVDVITIDGRGKSARKLPAVNLPAILRTWEEVGGKLDGLTADDAQIAEQPAAGPAVGGDAGVREPSGTERLPVGKSGQKQPAGVGVGTVSGGERGKPVVGGEAGKQPSGTERKPGAEPGGPVGETSAGGSPGLEGFKDAFKDALDEEFGPKEIEQAKTRKEKKAVEVAQDAAKHATEGADKAMSGLVELFGGGKTLGMGVNFDKETYAKAKPMFEEAAGKFHESFHDIRELIRRLVGELRRVYGMTREALEVMEPYLTKFMEDVQSGAIKLGAKIKAAADTVLQRKEARGKETETEHQTTYISHSNVQQIGTLIPRNLKDPTDHALKRMAEQRGDLDNYVAREIGTPPEKLEKYYSGEQIDALAAAIHNQQGGFWNASHGLGNILGDQTGVGKGRVAAGMMQYAIKNGMIPIFVSKSPTLYKDIYRDMVNTGMREFLGRDPRILMTNINERIPLTDDESVELKTGDGKNHGAVLDGLTPDNFSKSYDVIFTTYAQMQTVRGQDTARRSFFDRMAPSAYPILDESHEAGGQPATRKKKDAAMNRAEYMRELIDKASAHGTYFSSATYAKRSDVMDLYHTTNMRLAVSNPKLIGVAMSRGGIPMQQVVAAMLTEDGQYMRREKSFAGIDYNIEPVEVDKQQYANFAKAIREINRFRESTAMKKVIENAKKLAAEEAGSVVEDTSLSISSTNFTAIMHNIIAQMALGLKAKPAAEMAIKAIKNGQKPILTLKNTLDSFHTQYANDMGLDHGQEFPATFNDLLKNYLKKMRTIGIKQAHSKQPPKRRYITDSELIELGGGQFLLDHHNAVKKMIEALDTSHISISPIDTIKSIIKKAGYNIGELTGRSDYIDYMGDKPIYRARPGSEVGSRGRNKTLQAFNNDPNMHGLLINGSASTGISAHAAPEFKDHSQRHMMIVQPHDDINDHMQTLGRPNRTGQVVVPVYSQLMGTFAAEIRPASVLLKKMASLNANTTGSRSSALSKTADVPDFMNEYGDEVAYDYLHDNPEINEELGHPVKFDESGDGDTENAMRKLTGRIPLLEPDRQDELYSDLGKRYETRLEQAEAAGENTLEAKRLDLQAKPIEQTEVVPQKQSGSAFAAPVTMEKASVRRLSKPFKPEEVVQKIAEKMPGFKDYEGNQLGPITPENAAKQLERVAEAGELALDDESMEERGKFESYKRSILDDITDITRQDRERARLNTIEKRWNELHRMMPLGSRISLKMDNGNYTAIVLDIKHEEGAKNPLAMSTWKAVFAVADANKQITVPFSKLFPVRELPDESKGLSSVEPLRYESTNETLSRFQKLQSDIREDRYIATGNLLAAYDWLGYKGQIVHFTGADGEIRQGILTAKDFDFTKYLRTKGEIITDPKRIIDWMKNHRTERVWSKDMNLSLLMPTRYGDEIRIEAKKAKAKGGIYYTDKELTGLTGDFYSRGSDMFGEVTPEKAPAAIKRMIALGAEFTIMPDKPPPTIKVPNEPGNNPELATLEGIPERRYPKIVSSKKMQEALLRQQWKTHGWPLDYDDIWEHQPEIWDNAVEQWEKQHPDKPFPADGSYEFGTYPDFERLFDEKYLDGKMKPFPGVDEANELFEGEDMADAIYVDGQIPDHVQEFIDDQRKELKELPEDIATRERIRATRAHTVSKEELDKFDAETERMKARLLMPDIYQRREPYFFDEIETAIGQQIKRVKLERDIENIISTAVGRHVSVDLSKDEITQAPEESIGWPTQVASKTTTGRIRLGGGYRPVSRLIRIAMSTSNPARIAWHEAWHAFEHLFATKDEMNVLKREEPRLRDIVKREKGFTDEEMKRLSSFEVRAIVAEKYAYERYAEEPAGRGIHIAIRRMFEKLLRILRGIHNYFNGLNFKTSEDIFDAFRKGEQKYRKAVPLADTSFVDSVRVENARMNAELSSVEHNADSRPTPAINGKIHDAIERLFRTEPVTQVVEKFQDYNIRVRQLRDLLLQRRMVPFGDHADFVAKKQLFPGKVDNREEQFEREHLDPLVKYMEKNNITLDEMGDYLYALHAEERNAIIDKINPEMKGAGSGMTNDEARQIIAEAKASGKEFFLRGAVDKVRNINDYILDTMERSGLESKATVEAWREQYENYVPLSGWEDAPEDAPKKRRLAALFNVRGPEVQRAMGRLSRADNPLVNILDQAYRTIKRSQENYVLNSLFNALKTSGDVSDIVKFNKGEPKRVIDRKTGLVTWKDDSSFKYRQNAVAHKIAGRTNYMVFEDERLAMAIKRMGPDQFGPVVQRLARLQNQVKSLWTHYSPDFLLRHFMFRYPIEAIMNFVEQKEGPFAPGQNSPSVKKFISNSVPFLGKASRAIFLSKMGKVSSDIETGRLQQEWEEMQRYGGAMKFRQSRDMDLLREHLQAQLMKLKKSPMGSVRAKLNAVREMIDMVTNALDNSLRLAAFSAAKRAGKSPQQAAIASREATIDFLTKGQWATLTGLWFPFSNVAIQTGARLGKAQYRSKYMRRLFGMTIGAGFLLGAFNYLMGGKDEDGEYYFDKMAEWEKSLNMILLNPFDKDEKGRPQPIKIPMPYNWANPMVWGYVMAHMAFNGSKDLDKQIAMLTRSTIQTFTPFGEEHGFWAKVIPDLVRPLYHVAENVDWRGLPIHRDLEWQKGTPKAEQSRATTGQGWRFVASGVNRLTGGDKFTPGYIDYHPEDYREVFNHYFGAQSRLLQGIYGVATGDAKSTTTPLERVIHGTDYDAADRGAYYEGKRASEENVGRLKAAAKDRSEEGLNYLREHGRVEGAHLGDRGNVTYGSTEIFNAAKKQLKILYDRESKETDPDQLKVIHEQQQDTMNRARNAYKQMRERATAQ